MFRPDPDPPLEGDEIQGNIVPGFLKPHMALLALRIGDRDRARRWCHGVASHITTLSQAMRTRQVVRSRARERSGAKLAALRGDRPDTAALLADDDIDDVWTSIAFSHEAVELLLAAEPGFDDPAFRLGMARRSASLGDPTDPGSPGHPGRWVVTDPHVLLVVAADREERLRHHVARMSELAQEADLAVVYQEEGHKLDSIGSEHFGFQDGVSQPGVRGTYGDGELITPRYVADGDDQRPESWLYGLPGQYLLWPGEFVFGYPGQGSDPLLAGALVQEGPEWTRNGSYLAFRRLRQDVEGFHRFLGETAAETGVAEDALASRIVGRWHSGAPVARTPEGDDVELGVDRLRNNWFEFGTPARTLALTDGGTTDGRYPGAGQDPIGLTCPQFAHIRKVNTRTSANDAGGRTASFDRRLLRRGLPYGGRQDQDKGLLFLSFQTSIVDQFEFLNRRWMGDHANPRSPGGHDLLIGQNGQPGEHRLRSAAILRANGTTVPLSAPNDFVTPTGGGYLFAPSITALRTVLGAVGT